MLHQELVTTIDIVVESFGAKGWYPKTVAELTAEKKKIIDAQGCN